MTPRVAEWQSSARTGSEPGNDVACGGRSSQCEKTGNGVGHDVACGGLAAVCDTTGQGPGNDAACGGNAAYCVTTNKKFADGSQGNFAVACGGDRFSRD